MNVAYDPWIPVVTTSGKPTMASLCDVLTEGEKYADLAVRPHERVSLMRLFLCVAHAALDGPRNHNEWCEVPVSLPRKVHIYFLEWNKDEKQAFELFHQKKPWLQVANLKLTESGKPSPVALLDFELATGNNSTLFDHQGTLTSRIIAPEKIALNLLTFQNFSPGGGAPIAQWHEKKTSQVGNPDAPCLSQSMAHCLLRGKNLAETIHLNLPTYDRIKIAYREYWYDKKKKEDVFKNVEFGRPVWECFPDKPDNLTAIQNATQTYLGRLVPISRWVRLFEKSDQMYCCNGFEYATHKDGFPAEPTAAVCLITKKDKKGKVVTERKVVGINPEKATWRELSALLTKRLSDGLGGPLAIENAPYDAAFDFQVCAMIRDQASMDIGIESVFHLSPAFQSNLSSYSYEVKQAEQISQQLRRAIEAYRNTIDNDWAARIKRTQAKDQWKLRNRLAQAASLSYWTTVEKNLPLLMSHIETIGTDAATKTREAWRKMLYASACDAYRAACGNETPRQMRAFAKGWDSLTTKKNDSESDNNKIKEDEV
ncbi:MAG: type I-E CRISPR-associated protein Cse1/CasA [Smithella sp.]|nr:type I-E CRISPR-associated protein Cse1/CasA [Smithella sp.]